MRVREARHQKCPAATSATSEEIDDGRDRDVVRAIPHVVEDAAGDERGGTDPGERDRVALRGATRRVARRVERVPARRVGRETVGVHAEREADAERDRAGAAGREARDARGAAGMRGWCRGGGQVGRRRRGCGALRFGGARLLERGGAPTRLVVGGALSGRLVLGGDRASRHVDAGVGGGGAATVRGEREVLLVERERVPLVVREPIDLGGVEVELGIGKQLVGGEVFGGRGRAGRRDPARPRRS